MSNDTEKLPSPAPLPSNLDNDAAAVIAAMDRHTAAMNRVADAFDRIATAHSHLADRAREWMEKQVKGW